MSHLAAVNATTDSEFIAFNILKQFMTPTFPYGFATIFGYHEQKYLPFPTSVPLVKQHVKIPIPPDATTFALMESSRHADRNSYAHATNHAAHLYNFASWLNLSEQETIDAYYAALLHDLGKVYYLDIVKLPRKLTNTEKESLNKHTILSYLILDSCHYAPIVRYSGLFHHYNHTRSFGYPQINEELKTNIAIMASEHKLPMPQEPSYTFEHITKREWLIMNAITLLDSLDAAIDPNRAYKTTVRLRDVLEDFETHDYNWNTLFDPQLKKPFTDYVKWLESEVR